MFYSQFILAKKGPLGTIWIAAHLEGKLRKNHVTDTNISASIDSILFPEVPIALRLSGHLLLGIVRIYSRKVNYLFHDCSEALAKIKHAFHCSSVNLPPDAAKVPFHSVTLPETFDFDELETAFRWGKFHASSGDFVVDHHVSARDLITLQEQTDEETQRSLFHQDERFLGSSDPYSILYESDEDQGHELSHASNSKASILQENGGGSALEEDVLPPLQMDDQMDIEREHIYFMQHLGSKDQSGLSLIHASKLFDVGLPGSSQSDPTEKIANSALGSVIASSNLQDIPDIEKLRSIPEQREPEPFLMELGEELVHSSNKPEKTGISINAVDELGPHDVEATPVLDEIPLLNRLSPSTVGDFANYTGSEDLLGTILEGRTPAFKVATSISREAPESAQQKRGRRKRKAVFDDKLVLSSLSMKKQLAGAADLLRQRRKMPLTEFGARRMQGTHHDHVFNRPSFPGLSSRIEELYSHVTRLSAKEQGNCPPTPCWNVHSCVNEVVPDANRMAEVENLLAHNDPLDGPEAVSISPICFPQNAQQTPSVDKSCADKSGTERGHTGSVTGKQEDKGARESELGLCDALPEEIPDFVLSLEVDDRVFDKEVLGALATQASKNVVDVAKKPLLSPSSASTSGQVLEKLDFLEDNRDKASFNSDADPVDYDHFIHEMNTSYPKRAKDNLSNGWSVRTKCVAKYLKSIFEEAEPAFGSQVSLDSLLKGRTRKEAARMYFETLVLKSRDYIHVEQRSGFAEIMLSATPLLSKGIL